MTIISAYASTSMEDMKVQFYTDLDTLLRSKPAKDKLILLGDFYARVDSDSEQWRQNEHSNGFLIYSKYAEQELMITSTVFRQANK